MNTLSSSPGRLALRRFLRNRTAVSSVVFLLLATVVSADKSNFSVALLLTSPEPKVPVVEAFPTCKVPAEIVVPPL